MKVIKSKAWIKLIFLCCVMLSIFYTGIFHAYPYLYYERVSISVNGAVIEYKGKITEDGAIELIRQYELAAKKPELLKIRSVGGNALAGIKLGNWVYDNGLIVEVSRFCFSSCANYILTAAEEVRLHRRSTLGWHGGARSKILSDVDVFERVIRVEAKNLDLNPGDELERFLSARRRLRVARINGERELFKKIGVDEYIVVAGGRWSKKGGRAVNKFKNKYRDPNKKLYAGFYYTLEDMRKFGIKNIVLLDGDWKPRAKIAGNEIFLANIESYWKQSSENSLSESL